MKTPEYEPKKKGRKKGEKDQFSTGPLRKEEKIKSIRGHKRYKLAQGKMIVEQRPSLQRPFHG